MVGRPGREPDGSGTGVHEVGVGRRVERLRSLTEPKDRFIPDEVTAERVSGAAGNGPVGPDDQVRTRSSCVACYADRPPNDRSTRLRTLRRCDEEVRREHDVLAALRMGSDRPRLVALARRTGGTRRGMGHDAEAELTCDRGRLSVGSGAVAVVQLGRPGDLEQRAQFAALSLGQATWGAHEPDLHREGPSRTGPLDPAGTGCAAAPAISPLLAVPPGEPSRRRGPAPVFSCYAGRAAARQSRPRAGAPGTYARRDPPRSGGPGQSGEATGALPRSPCPAAHCEAGYFAGSLGCQPPRTWSASGPRRCPPDSLRATPSTKVT